MKRTTKKRMKQIPLPEEFLLKAGREPDEEFCGYSIKAVNMGYEVNVNGNIWFTTRKESLKEFIMPYIRDEKLTQLGI